MSTGTPNPPAGIPAPPTAAQPPPLPSSASASGNSSLHGGSTYPPQYPGQPPLPPTGIYPNSGNMILSNKLGCYLLLPKIPPCLSLFSLNLGSLPPGASRGPGSGGNYSQMHGSSASSGMPVSSYPPAGYGMPQHVGAPPTGPPPGVYPGPPRETGGSVGHNAAGANQTHSSHYSGHGSSAPYNYHNSGYYAQGPPNHPPPSSYHQGPRY